MGEALTVGVRRERGCAIVTAVGEIDMATVTRLRQRLFDLAASGRPLVADLDQVSFIDSAGLGALVGTANARRRVRRQPVCGLRPAADPAAVPPGRAGPQDTAGPYPGRRPKGPGGGPDHC